MQTLTLYECMTGHAQRASAAITEFYQDLIQYLMKPAAVEHASRVVTSARRDDVA